MSVFGWSYPPGCNGTPFDEDHPCDVCLNDPDQCVCPPCPECGETGRQLCYQDHKMSLSTVQKESRERHEKTAREAIEAESKMIEKYLSEEQ